MTKAKESDYYKDWHCFHQRDWTLAYIASLFGEVQTEMDGELSFAWQRFDMPVDPDGKGPVHGHYRVTLYKTGYVEISDDFGNEADKFYQLIGYCNYHNIEHTVA